MIWKDKYYLSLGFILCIMILFIVVAHAKDPERSGCPQFKYPEPSKKSEKFLYTVSVDVFESGNKRRYRVYSQAHDPRFNKEPLSSEAIIRAGLALINNELGSDE